MVDSSLVQWVKQDNPAVRRRGMYFNYKHSIAERWGYKRNVAQSLMSGKHDRIIWRDVTLIAQVRYMNQHRNATVRRRIIHLRMRVRSQQLRSRYAQTVLTLLTMSPRMFRRITDKWPRVSNWSPPK